MIGVDWQRTLSKSLNEAVGKTASKARDQRPHEPLADDWGQWGSAGCPTLSGSSLRFPAFAAVAAGPRTNGRPSGRATLWSCA